MARQTMLNRCDNGPEYISGKLGAWAAKHDIKRYNRTVRHDWLAQYLFESIAAVQDYATQWLWHYNNERPYMGLDGITTKQKLAIVA